MRTTSGWIATAAWTGALAFLLTIVTGGIWTGLLLANLSTTPAVPWAAVVMALVLWLVWAYLGGSTARRRYLRASPVSASAFSWALLAGSLSIVALAGFWIVLFRLVRIPGNALPDLSTYSVGTVVAILTMASLVSSVAEEAGFRGYFQGVLEKHVSGPGSVLIAAVLIAPAHGLTQGFVWPVALFYFLVDTMLGTTAYLTRSILPGIAIHSMGLLTFFSLIWPRDKQRQLISGGGADRWFWLHVAQAVIFAALAIMAFKRLANAHSSSSPDSFKVRHPPSSEIAF
jgi:membrane protease YdiL (CAAX protease family)